MRGAQRFFANGAQGPVKAPFLAQLDFSWSSVMQKQWPREKYWLN